MISYKHAAVRASALRRDTVTAKPLHVPFNKGIKVTIRTNKNGINNG